MTVKTKNEGARSLAFGSISSSYANLGTPTTKAAYQVTVVNNTDALMIFSKDGGATDWIRLPGSSFGIWYFNGETEGKSKGRVQKGTQFQVKDAGSSASSGEVSISLEYLE
jgi:hypothetical protein